MKEHLEWVKALVPMYDFPSVARRLLEARIAPLSIGMDRDASMMSATGLINVFGLALGGFFLSSLVGWFVTGLTSRLYSVSVATHAGESPSSEHTRRESAAKPPSLIVLDHGVPCIAVIFLFVAIWWKHHAVSMMSVIPLLIVISPRLAPLSVALSSL